ncbi:hypothetical protein T05_4841, partial [Trichinella murrelli]
MVEENIPEEVGEAEEEIEIKDDKNKKKKSMRISKSKKKKTVSKKARAKEDLSPLKAEIKSEDNIRKLAYDMKGEEIETKKLTPM